MVMRPSSVQQLRLRPTAGIAIGPILFIIGILGILAAAIAAGSGSFTANTTTEGARAKASALIDIGQILKIGFDHVIGNGVDFDSVSFNVADTTDADHLFSAIGGGITAPSTTMGFDPTLGETWHYLLITIPRLGSADRGSRVAVFRVTEEVCDEINLRANALPIGTAKTEKAIIGDFDTAVGTVVDGALWPASFKGKTIGCVNNLDATTIPAGFYFYQVMGVR